MAKRLVWGWRSAAEMAVAARVAAEAAVREVVVMGAGAMVLAERAVEATVAAAMVAAVRGEA